jgi:isopenicillin N synthase-like dioxygenase
VNQDAATLAEGYVPVIDISPRRSAPGRGAVAEAIGAACARSGFFVIVGHDVPRELIARMSAVTSEFFELPDAEKDLVAQRPGTSGFRRAGGTTARSLDQDVPPDLSETFAAHVTGELSDLQRAALGDYSATWKLANIWPATPSGFTATWHEYMHVMGELSADLMRLCSRALGLPENHHDHHFDKHVSALVANYYPPRPDTPLPGQMRRSAHTDFGALTVLHQQDGRGGLQVRHGVDDWRDVRALPDSFVVNIGDLMAVWSDHRWVSTMHRVINPADRDRSARLSVPFFYQPNHDAPMHPDHEQEPGITAGEWMADKTRKLFLPIGGNPVG